MCPSSGTTSFESASSTAAVDPGTDTSTRPRATPATARDSIAAAPISWNDSIRNSSPKPSSRLSSSPTTASYVVSRGASPVPPFTITAWIAGSASRASIQARISAGSSGRMADVITRWPPASSSARARAPLVSVSGVRVSLTVSTAHPTDVRPFARCSCAPTRADLNPRPEQRQRPVAAPEHGRYDSGRVRTVYLETYGCQMNVADSELILGHLQGTGYTRTDAPDAADVILLNTCAIREHAEARVLGRLGELARHKAARPGVRIGVLGCMAQHLRDRLRDQAPQVDLLVGPDGYRRLPALLADDEADPQIGLRLDPDETYADLPVAREGGVRAWVTAMRGCDRFCTFCIVPYVRGRERSLPGPVLVDQVRALVDAGVKEVVYLGQTVNAYRHDGWDFAELLRRTAAVPGLARIRFTSPHPAEMSERVIDAMAECAQVAPQLHLPVQSGSDPVLERMARDYTVGAYEALVDRLRNRVSGIAFSTDVIAGFPGETADDFAATEALMRRIRYDSAFLFKYSRRAGTRAYKWDDDVPDAEKASRLERLIALQERISGEINRTLVGSDVEVLVEGPARRPDGWMMGKSPQMKTVVFPGPAPVGSLARVRVEAATSHTLTGRML